MKYLILTFFVLLFFSDGIAQNKFELDRRNGFKEFKLGETYDKWKSDLSYNQTLNGTDKYYAYTGSCCWKLFSYNLKSINLGFRENKLIAIYLVTEKFQTSKTMWNGTGDYDKIVSNFTMLFGKPDIYDVPENSAGMLYQWNGKKVLLGVEYIFVGGDVGDWCNVLVAVNDIYGLESGF